MVVVSFVGGEVAWRGDNILFNCHSKLYNLRHGGRSKVGRF